MGLINLYTDLKSLKFGKDRIGGGSSNQPYIKTPIPEKIGEFGYLNQDFILRGGSRALTDSALDVVRLGKYFTDLRNPSGLLFVAKQNLLSRMAVRTQASGKILNEGIYTPLSTLAEAGGVTFGLHVNKQGLNPFGGIGGINTYSEEIKQSKTSIGWDVNDRLVVLYGFKIINDDPVYNLKGIKVTSDEVNVLSYQGGPGSILGIGNTNIKFADQRTGINNPELRNSNFFTENGTDYSVFLNKPNELVQTQINYRNALGLSVKYTNKDINYEKYDLKSDFSTGLNNVGQGFTYFIGQDDNKLISDILNKKLAKTYQANGFSDSSKIEKDIILPVGITSVDYGNLILSKQSIKSSRNGLGSNYFYALKPPATPLKTNFVTYTQNQIEGASPVTKPYGTVIDFRMNLKSTLLNNLVGNNKNLFPSPQIQYNGVKRLEERTNLGDPGNKTGKNLKSYTNGIKRGEIVGVSGGNASNNSYDKINVLSLYSDTTAKSENTNDLIKFRIGVIDNDQPDKKTYIHFRAFLNQISDGYTSDWSGTKYIGRGENFYTYGGFDRKVSLSWTVAAQSKAELIPMYKKLNYLASICAPDYSANGYMRGNLVTLTIGGYFFEQPGIITGFSYEMNDDNSTWEIGINDTGNADPTVKELPHTIKVSGFSFIPIHTFVPRKQLIEYTNGNGLVDNNKYGPERYIALNNGDNNNYGPVALHTVPEPIPSPNPNPAPTSQNTTDVLAATTYNVTPVSNGRGGTPTVVADKYDWGIDPNKKVTIPSN
jgi:hypothetical protein